MSGTVKLTPGQHYAYIRDVPRSCTCAWAWVELRHRWVIEAVADGCTWHSR